MRQWLAEQIDTVNRMFSAQQRNNISVDDIYQEHYSDKPPVDPAANRKSIQQHLPRFRKILCEELGYDVVCIGKYYFDGFHKVKCLCPKSITSCKHREPQNLAEGHRCLPARGKKFKTYGLHVLTTGVDWIWLADVERNMLLGAGSRKNVMDRLTKAVNNGNIPLITAQYFVKSVYERYPLVPLNNNKLLSEEVDKRDIDVFKQLGEHL